MTLIRENGMLTPGKWNQRLACTGPSPFLLKTAADCRRELRCWKMFSEAAAWAFFICSLCSRPLAPSSLAAALLPARYAWVACRGNAGSLKFGWGAVRVHLSRLQGDQEMNTFAQVHEVPICSHPVTLQRVSMMSGHVVQALQWLETRAGPAKKQLLLRDTQQVDPLLDKHAASCSPQKQAADYAYQLIAQM